MKTFISFIIIFVSLQVSARDYADLTDSERKIVKREMKAFLTDYKKSISSIISYIEKYSKKSHQNTELGQTMLTYIELKENAPISLSDFQKAHRPQNVKYDLEFNRNLSGSYFAELYKFYYTANRLEESLENDDYVVIDQLLDISKYQTSLSLEITALAGYDAVCHGISLNFTDQGEEITFIQYCD